MKKIVILSLLVLLCSCQNSNSSSNTSGSLNSSSSSSSETYISSTYEIKDVKLRDLEFELNDTKDGYLIKKYKKYDPYIKLPEQYEGLPIVGISEGAFLSSGGVIDVYMPDTYIEVNSFSFSGCTTIINYYVNDTHSLYKSIDGVLYTKNEESLVAFPTGRKKSYDVQNGTKNILDGSFATCLIENVTLPESIETIGHKAFYEAKKLKKINVPSKVQTINDSAFELCLDLNEVAFNEGLKEIGYKAFWGCAKLRSLEFPSTLIKIGTSAFEQCTYIYSVNFSEGLEVIDDFAFAYCANIGKIQFPSTLKRINKYAFIQNFVLETLNLNEGLEVLEEGAFYYSTNLKKVNIPSTLKEIGYDCFTSSDSSIKEFYVVDNSSYFKSVDKVLFTKDGKELVCFPAKLPLENKSSSYIVPEGTEIINDHAFYNSLTLESITLPSTLKKLGCSPFYMCQSLKNIKYLGTMSQFEKIEKVVEVFVTDLATQNIYWNDTYFAKIREVECSDGTIVL